MPIYADMTELVGHTPLMRASRLSRALGLETDILVKIESFNPLGSVKDRVGLKMIEEAEKSGALKPGGLIIEPTSGNTGVGIAGVASARGYRTIIVMPDTMSLERRMVLEALGAELVLTPGAEGMKGSIRKAEELRDAHPGAIIMGQFDNPANPLAHVETTGPEIWEDTEGAVGVFVAGVGTGGTVSGTGRYLKSRNPDVHVAAVEPDRSPILSGGKPGPHAIQGIGANFIPKNYDAPVVDEVVRITDEDAYEGARAFAKYEGLLVGVSSGAAIAAAAEIARRPEMKGRTIVALLPDTGDRYLSTPLFRRG